MQAWFYLCQHCKPAAAAAAAAAARQVCVMTKADQERPHMGCCCTQLHSGSGINGSTTVERYPISFAESRTGGSQLHEVPLLTLTPSGADTFKAMLHLKKLNNSHFHM
jgi:hypothetical protein